MKLKPQKKNALTIDYSYDGESGVLLLNSPLDTDHVPFFEKQFDVILGRIASNKDKKLEINLKNVRVIDTSGFAFLIELIHQASEHGYDVKLENLKNLMALAKLYDLEDFINRHSKQTNESSQSNFATKF